MRSPRELARTLKGWLPRRPRPVVLMYHRVADRRCDPWGLCVPPELFQDQITTLARARRPLPLTDFVDGCRSGDVPDTAVALTFDDGYADNARVAAPMLHGAGVPATMFVTSETVVAGAAFWWDRLADIVFAPAALRGSVALQGSVLGLDEPPLTERDLPRPDWRAFAPTRSARARLYVRLWEALQVMPAEERESALRALHALREVPAPDPDDLPMTREELARLPSALIEVAGHGTTHRPLTRCSPSEQEQEVAQSRATIAALTGVDSASFAYPHGEQDASVRRAARAAGIERACTTRETAVNIRAFDPLAIPRLAVGRWTGAELLRRMRALGA